MSAVERKVKYFTKNGSENTEQVLEAVKRRIKEGGIRTIVVASTTGETGAKFAKGLKGFKVIVVSRRKMDDKHRQQITKDGGDTIEDVQPSPLEGDPVRAVRDSFATLGQGFKAAVEVILVAADRGKFSYPPEDVVGVGGTGSGADVAIIARATASKDIFSPEKSKALAIREIIAMPLAKAPDW
jgi:hypothetical protein